ncbi:MAG: hypothetical protein M3464_15865 [Chloroflexota bacterium]|nr:hypothetical protein [Chloroflexota bacterium]
MNTEQQRIIVADTLARVRTGQISRREAARTLAALSLAAAGVATLGAGGLRATSPAAGRQRGSASTRQRHIARGRPRSRRR